MATEDEILKGEETKIREKAEKFKIARDAFTDTGFALKKAVEDYNAKREKLQREDFARKALGWCQECEKAYPETSIVLLYTEGIERRGSHQDTYYSLARRVQSFCNDCAKMGLGYPHGGECQFKCFLAEKRGEEFFIFVSEKWIPISKPEDVLINIEQEDLSEEDYDFGEKIVCMSGPLRLKIGEKKVV